MNERRVIEGDSRCILMVDVRRATIQDAETLAQNNLSLAQESEETTIGYDTALAGVLTLLRDTTKGFFLVAEEQGEIIGQMMITFEWSDWRNRVIWWLQSVYVHPKSRKKGVFTRMVKQITQEAKSQDVKKLRLYVHRNNTPAIQVYERLGMEQQPYIIYEMPT